MAEHKSMENWGRSKAAERHGGGNQKAGAVRMDGLPQASTGKLSAGLVSEPTPNELERAAQAPQDPVDRHGPGYDNDVAPNSWLRGMGGVPYPHFDAGASGHRYGRKK